MLKIRFLDQAARSLKKLIKKAPKIARKIECRITELRENPEPPSSIPLVGYAPLRRVRVDKYRIVYKRDGECLKVFIIEKRDKVYKNLIKVRR